MIRNFLLGAMALFSMGAYAQKNEIKLNILNTIAIASVEVGYERFLADNQSVDFEVFFNDRFSYFPEKGNKDFKATSIKLGYNYYFDLDGLTGPYISPFIKQRFGKYIEDGKETSLNSFIIGLGFGYIWNYNDTFTISPYVNIGRNFGKEINESGKFWAVEPNAGFRIGYRF